MGGHGTGKFIYKLDGVVSEEGDRQGGSLQGMSNSLFAAQLLMAIWALVVEAYVRTWGLHR